MLFFAVDSGTLMAEVIGETTAASLVCSGSAMSVVVAAAAAAALVTSLGTGTEGASGADAGIKGTVVVAAAGSEMGGKLKPDDKLIGTAGDAAASPLGRVVRLVGRDIGGIIVGWRGAIDAAAPGFIIAVENAGIDTLGNPGIEIGVVRGGSDDKFGIFGKAVGGGRVDVDPGGNVKVLPKGN